MPFDNASTPTNSDAETSKYLLGERWLFSPQQQTVEIDGESHFLRKKNAQVLQTLIEHANEDVSNTTLYQKIWGAKVVSEGVIKRSICDLRNLFGDNDKTMIVTIPKVGYRLSTSVQSGNNLPKPKPVAPEQQSQTNTQTTAIALGSSQGFSWQRAIAMVSLVIVTALTTWFFSNPEQPRQAKYEPDQPSLLLRELLQVANQNGQGEKALEMVNLKLQVMDRMHPDKPTLAKQLIHGYLQLNQPVEAITINEKLIRDAEVQFGDHSLQALRARQLMVETLMAANKRREAFDLAKQVLKDNQRDHPNALSALAKSYQLVSWVNLTCRYPSCTRTEAISNGRESAETALAIYRQAHQPDPIAIADGQMLLNWFTIEVDSKVQLLTDALEAYRKNLGQYDAKTAEALWHLGRLHVTYQNDPDTAIEMLNQALEIYQFNYEPNNREIRITKQALAEAYLFAQNFDKSIEYLNEVLYSPETEALCSKGRCIESQLMQARAYLYRGDLEQAKQMTSQIQQIVQDNDLKLSFSTAQELKAITLRTATAMGDATAKVDELLEQIKLNNATEQPSENGYAVFVVELELYHQLMLSDAQKVDTDRYLWVLNSMVEMNDNNPYISGADIYHLLSRAEQSCQSHSTALCEQLKARGFETMLLTNIPPLLNNEFNGD